MSTNSMPACRSGFTLIEILVVVVIMGILAMIVIPTFGDVTSDSLQSAFVTDIKTFASAEAIYRCKTMSFLEDSSSGVCPAGFEPYIDEDKWEAGTPLGGVWDAELNSFGIISGLGVHFQAGPRKDDAFMIEVDALLDDGDLATGIFRKIADDRYYLIVHN
ncbi:MAG: prepilin-type N-terminal cleavage/methylation domain-containing protein [Sedimentisphaerales bacterium]|nr:prepilin-type N-terminal cleavage/methylation domain-containing protein [Sedimentisphaerales bacterium]